ncbi:MAG TPA: trypsin-like peptidase domain-containing protein [Candidatus Binatia bacterium]|nr:trypsin-like peptidase domain-containing protein [Candidatus Binatia bacterium]
MSIHRKMFTLLFVVLLAAAFAACGADEDGEAGAQGAPTEAIALQATAEIDNAVEATTEPVALQATEEPTVEPTAEPTVEATIEPQATAEITATGESDANATTQDQENNTVAQGQQAPVVGTLEDTLHQIYQDVNPSVVHIEVVVEGGATQMQQIPGFTPPQQGPQFGEGSGFVWDEGGHIVTNNHVVADASTINVVFSDGTTVPGTVVGTDPDSDLAVLSVDAPNDLLDPVAMGDSTEVEVGELAVAIGNPFGQEGSLTVGVISALGRLLPVQSNTTGGPSFSIPDIIQTDASINPGNSGGVLLNDQGRVIGVTSAIISPARVSSGIGFAIPSRIVRQVVPVLIQEGEYQHPYLGIQGTGLTPALAQAMDLPPTQRGALVIGVAPEGPAAGVLQGSEQQATVNGVDVSVGGDVIRAIEGEPVNSMDDLITELERLGNVGETVTLTIIRNGEEQQVEVTLQARPETVTPQLQQVQQQAWLGILAATLTPPLAEAMELPADQTGILIGQVVEGSPASEAGLQGSDTAVTINGQQTLVGGDVIIAANGQDVPDMMALQQILAHASPGDQLTLTILRDGEQMDVNVTLANVPQ